MKILLSLILILMSSCSFYNDKEKKYCVVIPRYGATCCKDIQGFKNRVDLYNCGPDVGKIINASNIYIENDDGINFK